jgi:aminopeptidase C
MKLNRDSLKKLIIEELDRGQEFQTGNDTGQVSKANNAIMALRQITDVFPGHEVEIAEFADKLQALLDGDKPKPRTGQPDSPMR